MYTTTIPAGHNYRVGDSIKFRHNNVIRIIHSVTIEGADGTYRLNYTFTNGGRLPVFRVDQDADLYIAAHEEVEDEEYYDSDVDFSVSEVLRALKNLTYTQKEYPLIVELEDQPESCWTINEVVITKGFVVLRSIES